MGTCNSHGKNKNNINRSSSILQYSQISSSMSKNYKFNYAEKNNMFDKSFNLKFIFYNFKVKYCVSHKPTKDSLYVTEIRIGDKLFPLIINKGQSPNIPNQQNIQDGYFEQKQYTISELENKNLSINIYEFLEDISSNINGLQTGLPEEYKQKSNYRSFFSINLLSFLFKSIKCDFPMTGDNQLSQNTRITFFCLIEHREKVIINAGAPQNPNIHRLIFQSKDSNLNSTIKKNNNYYSLITEPITMLELQRADLFLETNENGDNYDYISLNSLKAQIIKEFGEKLMKEENNFNNIDDPNNNDNQNSTKNHLSNILNYNNQLLDNGTFLYFENLPIISQISNLYFTDYGNVYNTSLFNMINADENLQNFRKNKQISSDDFYNKLFKYYKEISKPNFNINIINEIQTLLLRSIENYKFMFIYPSIENLNKMVILFLQLGLKIIEIIKRSSEEYTIILLLKLISILMSREELDNMVIYECINKFKSKQNNPQNLYNKLIFEIFFLYQLLLSNRFSPINDVPLLELFSRLYFQKKYLRHAILNTLNGQKYQIYKNDTPNLNDIFLYDIINDEKLDEYLNNNTKESINNFLMNKDYFKVITFDYYRLLKLIMTHINETNINQYPLDFTLFSDNLNILQIIKEDINELKSDNYNRNKFNKDFYESLMFLSDSYYAISEVNNSLIQATNGHNAYAVYTLFVYFKSLLDYYYSANNNTKLIMDYSMLELASEKLTENENSQSLPRLFWFYYCCSHMILSGNLKWFIVNIINKYFDKFVFHWSFTIRQVFFKLSVFIFCIRLKDAEGKLFKKEKLKPFATGDMGSIPENLYKIESYKDFNVINKEFNIWSNGGGGKNIEEYPIFDLPIPIIE